MAKRDTEFARTAIALKLVSQPQAQECLTLYTQRRKRGERLQLAAVFVEKGYLTQAQVGQVVTAMRQPRVSHIGRYKLLAKIGQGGMGTVYKARQESLDKIVALKVLAPGLAKQKDYVERFIREAQSSGQLNHPNIVLGIDAGETDGYYYFAMEFVDGETVKALLQREGKLDERRALEIALAMAKALEHAAEHHIVHRDVKPGNILLAAEGTSKLVDLGLAKEVRGDHSITQAGIPVGTPYYISPEQVRGQEQVDIRADVYALGGTLYHMLTGQVPYDGPTAAVVMTRHLNDDVPDPREHAPRLSDAAVAIIHRCMAKEPDDRYGTPSELREDLEAALAEKPLRHARGIGARAHRAAQRAAERRARKAAHQRKLMITGGTGAGVVALVVVLLVVFRGNGGETGSGTGRVTRVRTQRRPEPRTSRQPRPRTATQPKLDTTVAVARKAAAVLKELLAFAAEDDDRESIEARFQDFVLQYAGTPSAQRAKAHLGKLKAGWKAEDDFRATIAEHLREHRFAEAQAALAKPPFEHASEAVTEMLEALRRQVRRAAAEHIEAETARGEKLIDQGELEEARKVYRELAKLGLDEASEASASALARIDQLEAQRRQRQAQRTLAQRVVQAGKAIEDGRLDDAKDRLDPAQAEGNDVLAAYLKQARRDVDRIGQLFEAVEAELRKRARDGTRTYIKGIGRTIAKVENGTIHVKVGRETYRIHELQVEDIGRLECAPAPELLPLLALYRGKLDYARAELDGIAGDDAAHYRQLLDWVGAIGREGEAAELLAKARTLADDRKWADAQAAVTRLLKDYADTGSVEKHRGEINELATRCTMALAALRREDETIRPFIDVSDRCGDLAKAFKAHRIVGGWVMDIDNDERLDVALDCRGKKDPRVPVFLNRTERGSKDLVFKDATLYCGLDTGEEPICWADLDGDGDLDVVCRGLWQTRGEKRTSDHKKLAIYENRGKGAPLFKLHPQVSMEAALAQAPGYAGYGFGNIAVLDANGDGRADILAQYVRGQTARTLTLFLSAPGKLSYRDASARAGFFRLEGKKVSIPDFLQVKAWPVYVVFDADRDHLADFILNTDTGMVFRNRKGSAFRYYAKSSLVYKTYGQPDKAPLVVPACADYDNDGDMDVFVPQFGRNLLYRNDGTGRFTDAMHTAGPMATDEARSLWATWADVNNDGLLDLFVCNDQERNRLYIQKANHVFVNKAEEYGCTGEKSEKTNFVAFGDVDRDGDLDMLVLRESGRSQLLLNPYVTGNNRFSLSVLVRPAKGAIGAKVHLYRGDGELVGMQQVCRVESFNVQTSREAFFGVPSAGEYRVVAYLSNGTVARGRTTIDPTRVNRLILGK